MRRPTPSLTAAHLKALPRDVVYERGRAALIVIEMQNDFCSAGGWIESLGADVAGARALFEPINSVDDAWTSEVGAPGEDEAALLDGSAHRTAASRPVLPDRDERRARRPPRHHRSRRLKPR